MTSWGVADGAPVSVASSAPERPGLCGPIGSTGREPEEKPVQDECGITAAVADEDGSVRFTELGRDTGI
ncbi:hypothetical protein NDU88_001615 [Pleurodeles waltl]|uniref:Uncharacterized protein n=1 Tax=Pleurodeles waltl TaxID=8319 RepID=A0AAV7WMN1_PLEWA|nr:hypothetical protein NDU88_001615 [Pleurodeles waltl]